MRTLYQIIIVTLVSSFLTLSACAKEVETELEVANAAVEKVKIETDAVVTKVVNNPGIKRADILNSGRVDIRPEKTADSEWVKISGPKEGAPTGTKKIPVMEELEPAEEFLNLAQYKGKVVYLDFWASWCVPCRDSFPFMNKVQEKYKDDLVVIAVNLDEEKANAKKFLEAYPANFKIVYDQLWQAGRAYGIYGLPFSFVYNRKGELVGKHGGFKEGDEINLDAALQNLIEAGE